MSWVTDGCDDLACRRAGVAAVKLPRVTQTVVLALAMLMFGVAAPADASAQEVDTDHAGAQSKASEFKNRRTLSGHTFMPSRFVGQPFVAGWLRALVGGGVASGLLVSVRDLDGNVLRTANGELTFLMLDGEYQQRLGSWGAFRLGATAGARTGTDQASVLAQGIEAQYGLNLGATIRILQSDRVALSGVADVRLNQVYAYNLFRFLKNVIDNGFDPEDDNELLDSGTTNVYTAGLRVAYSPSKWFGFAAVGEGGLGTPFLESQGNSGVASLGVSAEFDLGAGTKVPIGFQAFLKWENFSDLSPELSDDIWRTGLVIGYTGVEDFYSGLEFALQRLGVREDVPGVEASSTLDSITLSLVMRHYF